MVAAPTDTAVATVALPTTTPTPAPSATAEPTEALPTPTLAPTPTSLPSPITDARGISMVFVPGGPYEMGSENGEFDERPVHTVTLDGFYISQHEVTNAQFAAFLTEADNESKEGATWLDHASAKVRIHQVDSVWQPDEGYADHPVIEVTWYGAAAFCQSAGQQLPTEAEWAKAARGTDGQAYPWGDSELSTDLLNLDFSIGDTTAVGSYPDGASPFGALDMAGNVWEWVADWYAEDYYATSPAENPTGPPSGSARVLRGGAWDSFSYYAPSGVPSADRHWQAPIVSDNTIGFRCVGSP